MYMNLFSERYNVKNINLTVHSSWEAEAITISVSESNHIIVISLGRDKQEWKCTYSTSFNCLNRDESGAV